MNKNIIIILPLLLSGCETIYGWADSVGKHMPTIGEPCRNWQCMTDSGQKKSDQTKWLEEATGKPPVPGTDQQPLPQTATKPATQPTK